MDHTFAKGIKFRVFIEEFWNMLLPSRCGACGDSLVKSERALCTSCLIELPRTRSHIYPCRLLEEKLYGRIPLDPAYAFLIFSRQGMTREMLHHIKYEGRWDLAWQLGRMYAMELHQTGSLPEADLLVPVPLHRSRAWKRGYNQAEWFARGFASVSGTSLAPRLLRRTGRRSSQTSKSRIERWGRMHGQFELNDATGLQGKTVLLADDVITTGSTLAACAEVLYNAGAGAAGIITLAVVK